MSCALWNVGCHIEAWIAGLWWLPYVIWGLLGLFALVALAKVKELAGWPGVISVLSLGTYGYGYWRGKTGQSINPIEQLPEDHPDAVVPDRPTPKKKPKPILADTSIFEDFMTRLRKKK